MFIKLWDDFILHSCGPEGSEKSVCDPWPWPFCLWPLAEKVCAPLSLKDTSVSLFFPTLEVHHVYMPMASSCS